MRFGRLLNVIIKSEYSHYARIFKLVTKMHTWPGRLIAWPIIAILVTIFHYLFSWMHTLFEISLMIVNPRQFDNNMLALEKKHNAKK